MRHGASLAAVTLSLALSGCAVGSNPRDPLENFNRAMFNFNDRLDDVALRPAAEGYSKLPSMVRTGVNNFFGNLGDVWTAVNNLLQGKIGDGVSDVMRFAVNTTFGLGGLLDWGTEMGITKHKEDFGQTLGTWGVKPGPYVVLPVFGSSTIRDSAALPVDLTADPLNYISSGGHHAAGIGLRIVDVRAGLLDASNLLEEAALDRYEFVRDAYLQRRESTIRDGETSRSSYEDDGAPKTASQPGTPDAAKPEAATEPAAQEPASKPLVEVEREASPAAGQGIAPVAEAAKQ
ncbi:phospholipid-binding lipoprotein MlaA [Noviherbaspirillum humi]|uniref:Phospholipid-binding lipoprotein MlaA n=1 Tax=Noviherbaspirillum humi TaxID=1688639 RepID=A0A239JDS0_9BURK|nr:VacJ family lipoprotein [Noviherbaspirillum humi]SNT03980.1 phospholipid-binding lipoprotein MlaA [Noviherbaspirillum humi]